MVMIMIAQGGILWEIDSLVIVFFLYVVALSLWIHPQALIYNLLFWGSFMSTNPLVWYLKTCRWMGDAETKKI
jgi:hypothetical protein